MFYQAVRLKPHPQTQSLSVMQDPRWPIRFTFALAPVNESRAQKYYTLSQFFAFSPYSGRVCTESLEDQDERQRLLTPIRSRL